MAPQNAPTPEPNKAGSPAWTHELSQAIADSDFLGLAVTTPEGKFIALNNYYRDLLQLEHRDISSFTWRDLTRPEDLAREEPLMKQLLAAERDSYSIDKGLRLRSGKMIQCRVHVSAVRDDNDAPVTVFRYVQDVTEFHKAAIEVGRQRDRLELALETAFVGVWDWWPDEDRVEFSDIWKRQLGHAPNEIEDSYEAWAERLHPADRERAERRLQEFRNKPLGDYSDEFRLRHKDGSYRYILNRGRAQLDPDGEGLHLFGNHIDVTDFREKNTKLQLHEALAKAFSLSTEQESFQAVLKVVLGATQSEFGMVGYVDENGDMVYPSMTREIWDACQMDDRSMVFPKESWGGLWGRSLEEKVTLYSNEPMKVPTGHVAVRRSLTAPILHRGEVIGHLHVANKKVDYTRRDAVELTGIANYISPIMIARLRRMRMEQRVVAAKKLGAVGTFAAGAAHDFNNKMQVISGFAECLRERVKGDQAALASIETIEQAAMATSAVCHRLLKFTSALKSAVEPCSIAEVLSDIERDLRSELSSSRINLKIELPRMLPRVFMNQSDLYLVIRELVVNSVEAIREKGEEDGAILIEAVSGPLTDLAPGDTPAMQVLVTLVVRDNGAGIAREDLERIREPFFTTKFPGRGLGLSTVHGIVDARGGRLVMSGAPGQGATARLELPVAGPKATVSDSRGDAVGVG